MSELESFERAIRKHLDQFLDPKPAPRRPQVSTTKGLTVTLAVREKRLAADQRFTHHSNGISKLQARLEAEQAARQAGWPIIGFVIDYQ